MFYNRFYLKLGSECNFNCNHCSQGKIERKTSTHKVSKEVIDFLDKYVVKYSDKKTTLRLWGGEPLLYFDAIEFLVSRYKSKFIYTIISNGSLLNEKIIDFLNENEITFVLSHDGPATKFTRNIDVLENSTIKSLFDKIKKRSILSVLNARNPYYHTIFDYYKELGYYGEMNIRMVWVLNHNGTKSQQELSDININEFLKGTEELFSRAISHEQGKSYYPQEYDLVRGLVDRSYDMLTITKNEFCEGSKYIHKCTNCGYYGTGSKLEFDIQGNVYDCHNSDKIVGHISEDNELLAEKIKASIYNTQKETSCEDCQYNYFCQGLCNKTVAAGDKKWCELYKVTYDALIKYLMEKNDV